MGPIQGGSLLDGVGLRAKPGTGWGLRQNLTKWVKKITREEQMQGTEKRQECVPKGEEAVVRYYSHHDWKYFEREGLRRICIRCFKEEEPVRDEVGKPQCWPSEN